MNPNDNPQSGAQFSASPGAYSVPADGQVQPPIEAVRPASAVSAALTGQVNPLIAKTAVDDAATPNPVNSAAPAIADDGDLIEQEWVIKAKLLVMRTSQDPYEQNKQLAAFRADYLQKRYNKTIKLNQ